jgi:hypothetical protein
MSKLQRVNSFVTGTLMILFAGLLVLDPKNNFILIVAALSIFMMLGAIKMLWYYFTTAKLMVGGRRILYQGIIYLDLALFTWSLNDVPMIYIILYLIAINAFAGVVDMGLAINAKKSNAPSWRLKFSAGVVELGMAILCMVFIRSTNIVVWVYALGVAYSGLVRIIDAFRKTEVVYIQ